MTPITNALLLLPILAAFCGSIAMAAMFKYSSKPVRDFFLTLALSYAWVIGTDTTALFFGWSWLDVSLIRAIVFRGAPAIALWVLYWRLR